MRIMLVLLVIYIALNIGSHCRLADNSVQPPGCTQLGGTGLVFCPNSHSSQ
jgi:hypothetical protein